MVKFLHILAALNKKIEARINHEIQKITTIKAENPSFLIYIAYQGSLESWSQSQCLGERQGKLWAGHPSIARLAKRDRQSFTLTFICTGILEWPVYLICLWAEGETGEPEETHTDKG